MLKSILGILVAVCVIVACDGTKDSAVTESGIEVSFIEKGSADSFPVDGEILTLNMSYKDEDGKELYSTTAQGAPVAMQYIDSTWRNSGLIYEALREIKKGDSVTFSLPARDFYENTFDLDLPDTVRDGSDLTFFVRLVDNMSRDEFMAYQQEQYAKQRAQMDADMDQRLISDGDEIDQYLADQGIDAQVTESGLRYVITKQGQGVKPEPGQTVSVHYTGSLMDGTKFDSSLDRGEPLSFPIGQGNVIPGWDEGIALLNEGSQATLYIPSPLGYGPRGAGNVIPPFAILKFEVELVDVQ